LNKKEIFASSFGGEKIDFQADAKNAEIQIYDKSELDAF